MARDTTANPGESRIPENNDSDLPELETCAVSDERFVGVANLSTRQGAQRLGVSPGAITFTCRDGLSISTAASE